MNCVGAMFVTANIAWMIGLGKSIPVGPIPFHWTWPLNSLQSKFSCGCVRRAVTVHHSLEIWEEHVSLALCHWVLMACSRSELLILEVSKSANIQCEFETRGGMIQFEFTLWDLKAARIDLNWLEIRYDKIVRKKLQWRYIKIDVAALRLSRWDENT